MNPSPFENSFFSLFAFFPIIFLIINFIVIPIVLIFLTIMIVRFVKAHEAIARQIGEVSQAIKILKDESHPPKQKSESEPAVRS